MQFSRAQLNALAALLETWREDSSTAEIANTGRRSH
jgi:hypothetical protein